MVWGARFRNVDNVLQIDESFFCLCLVGKGSATAATTHPLTSRIRYVDLTYAGTYPLLALHIPVIGNRFGGIVATVRNPNGTWTSRVVISWPSLSAAPPGTWDFEWFLYDRPPNVVAPAWGMRVRNAAGEVVYHSSFRLMKVAGQPFGGVGGTYNYGAKVAVTAFGFWYVDDRTETDEQGNTYQAFSAGLEGFNCPSGGVFFDNRIVEFSQGSGAPWLPSTGLNGIGNNIAPLIIDVTGL